MKEIVDDHRLLVYLMTVAGVGIGVTLIDASVPENDIRKFSYAIADKLKKWNFMDYKPFGDDGAYAAYVDMAKFLKDKEAEEYVVAVGFWLTSNLKGTHPNEEELTAGIAIAKMFGISLHGWWDGHQRIPLELT